MKRHSRTPEITFVLPLLKAYCCNLVIVADFFREGQDVKTVLKGSVSIFTSSC